MKTTKLAILASMGALVLSATTALAGPSAAPSGKQPYVEPPQPPPPCGPWFAGFSGGVWWVQDYGTNVPFAPVPGDHEFNFETGFGLNAQVGTRLDDTLAVWLEGGFYQADVDSVTLPAGGGIFGATDGQLRLFPISLNVGVNVPIAEGFSFYASVGGGPVYRELEATVPAVALLTTFHDSGWDMLLQARAGVAFEVAQCVFVNVGYRWTHVFTSPDDINGHMAEVGVTVHFP
jgi:opacity protein-like surface antigen